MKKQGTACKKPKSSTVQEDFLNNFKGGDMRPITKKMFAVALIVVAGLFTQSAYAQMTPMDGSKIAVSKYPFSETVDILKGAIEQQNLMVLQEVDGQKMLKMAGKNVGGMKQIFFFHPMYMAKVLEVNEMAGIAVPLKLIVMEKDGKAMIRYFMPSAVLKPYKGTEGIASELDGLVNKIIAETTK